MSRNDIVEISATLEHETDNAVLLDYDEDKPAAWVPKSLCRRGEKDGSWVMPEWLAEREGFI